MSSKRDELAGWRDAEAHADFTLKLPGDGGPMFFRRIPPGEFLMGSRGYYPYEEPRHLVRFEREFWMGSFPVTQRQFRAFAKATGLEHSNSSRGSDKLPAENMRWDEAVAFCTWLGKLKKALQGRIPSLPTEAEWEYACRAGTTTEYWCGDGEAALAQVGWYDTNSDGRTHVVGELGPSAVNPWGLYDMHGNVDEWRCDAWDPDAYRKSLDCRDGSYRDNAHFEEGQADRVIRGGSWVDAARFCRSAYRLRWEPGYRYGIRGFRVCLLPGPVVQPATSPAEAQDAGRASGGTTRSRPQSSAGAAEPGKSSFARRLRRVIPRTDPPMEPER